MTQRYEDYAVTVKLRVKVLKDVNSTDGVETAPGFLVVLRDDLKLLLETYGEIHKQSEYEIVSVNPKREL